MILEIKINLSDGTFWADRTWIVSRGQIQALLDCKVSRTDSYQPCQTGRTTQIDFLFPNDAFCQQYVKCVNISDIDRMKYLISCCLQIRYLIAEPTSGQLRQSVSLIEAKALRKLNHIPIAIAFLV
jgi:hypothetical protein